MATRGTLSLRLILRRREAPSRRMQAAPSGPASFETPCCAWLLRMRVESDRRFRKCAGLLQRRAPAHRAAADKADSVAVPGPHARDYRVFAVRAAVASRDLARAGVDARRPRNDAAGVVAPVAAIPQEHAKERTKRRAGQRAHGVAAKGAFPGEVATGSPSGNATTNEFGHWRSCFMQRRRIVRFRPDNPLYSTSFSPAISVAARCRRTMVTIVFMRLSAPHIYDADFAMPGEPHVP